MHADEAWAGAVRTLDGNLLGRISGDSLNIRSAPSLDASVVGATYRRHTIEIFDVVEGDPITVTVDDEEIEENRWYVVGDDRFASAIWVEPFLAPPAPIIYEGHWVDVSLTEFYAVAYVDDRAVYAAQITAGRGGRTPPGEYEIFLRVRRETMDSATVGIPEGHPEYYYLENVQFSQYFRAGGFAIHGNYWTPPSAFGQFSSNGCVGLLNPDAEWFWNFLDIGSRVHIYYAS